MANYLIVYSTREGQTKKIAEFMREQLSNHQCEMLDLTSEAHLNLTEFDKIIVGASIRYGKLSSALYQWINEHKNGLEQKDASFFCVNLTARKAGKDTPEGSKYVQTFLKKSPWQPNNIGVFAGALYYPRYRWFDKVMIRFIMTMTGGETDTSKEVEYTDWSRVKAFVEQIEQV